MNRNAAADICNRGSSDAQMPQMEAGAADSGVTDEHTPTALNVISVKAESIGRTLLGGGTCDKGCKTCDLHLDKNKYHPGTRCKTCHGEGFLVVRFPKKTKLNSGNTDLGECWDPLKLEINSCALINGACRTWETSGHHYRGADKVRCQRVCHFGRANTQGIRKRADGSPVPFKGNSYSGGYEARCLFHKDVICQQHEKPIRCSVEKKLKCHAIVPSSHSGKITQQHKDECEKVRDPCISIAYMM